MFSPAVQELEQEVASLSSALTESRRSEQCEAEAARKAESEKDHALADLASVQSELEQSQRKSTAVNEGGARNPGGDELLKATDSDVGPESDFRSALDGVTTQLARQSTQIFSLENEKRAAISAGARLKAEAERQHMVTTACIHQLALLTSALESKRIEALRYKEDAEKAMRDCRRVIEITERVSSCAPGVEQLNGEMHRLKAELSASKAANVAASEEVARLTEAVEHAALKERCQIESDEHNYREISRLQGTIAEMELQMRRQREWSDLALQKAARVQTRIIEKADREIQRRVAENSVVAADLATLKASTCHLVPPLDFSPILERFASVQVKFSSLHLNDNDNRSAFFLIGSPSLSLLFSGRS